MGKAQTIEHETGKEVAEVKQLATTPMQMIAAMVDKGVDTDQLEKLLDLQERHESNEAKKAFFAARAAFAANPPDVIRDKENSQYGSRYSSLQNMVNTVTAALSEYGLSANWTVDQQDQIAVTCVLTHELGHSESVTIAGPPDDSGKKNTLQQIKSTLTYLKLATFEAITGIASVDGNVDDDGNAAGDMPSPDDEPATDEQLAKIEEWREAGKISEITEEWIKKASPLTVGQANHLLKELQIRNPK